MREHTISTPDGLVRIRPTRVEDAAAYRALRLDALRSHPEAFGADYTTNAERPFDYWQAMMQRGSGSESGVNFVAECDGALLGITVLAREEAPKVRHNANIYSVYVSAAGRGVGIADALINACLDWAKDADLHLVKLAVVATNVAAIRLYLRCGFTIYGVDPDAILWNGRYYDELMMVRRLS